MHVEQPAAALPKRIKYGRVVVRDAATGKLANDMITQATTYPNEALRITHVSSIARDDDGNPVVPDGHAIMIMPVNHRVQSVDAQGTPEVKADGSKKMVEQTKALASLVIPEIAALQQVDGGMDYVVEAVESKLAVKASNCMNKDTLEFDLPDSVLGWIESQREPGLGETYKALEASYTSQLRKGGAKSMQAQFLRACLRDATYAAAQFAQIEPTVWPAILDAIIEEVKTAGDSTATLERWQEERDQRGTEAEVQTISLSDLAIGDADKDADSDDTPEAPTE